MSQNRNRCAAHLAFVAAAFLLPCITLPAESGPSAVPENANAERYAGWSCKRGFLQAGNACVPMMTGSVSAVISGGAKSAWLCACPMLISTTRAAIGAARPDFARRGARCIVEE